MLQLRLIGTPRAIVDDPVSERLEAALPDGQRIVGPPWRIVGT